MGLSSPTYAITAPSGYTWIAGDTGLTFMDSFGTTFCVTGTSGVYDGAAVVLSQSQIPNGDGAYRSNSFRTPAVPVLSGWAKGSSPAGTIASRRAFVGLFQGGRQQTLTITDLDGSVLTMTVESNGNPKATPANSAEFDWQLSMVAADPDKYLPPVSGSTGLPTSSGGLDYAASGTGLSYPLDYGTVGSNGLVTLTNSGTDDAWPVFTLTGPTDGATLSGVSIVNTSTGETLGFTQTLVTGDRLVITTNPHNRAVKLNDVPYRRFLVPAQFFSVPPGSSVAVQLQGTSTSTTSQLSASVAPAFQ